MPCIPRSPAAGARHHDGRTRRSPLPVPVPADNVLPRRPSQSRLDGLEAVIRDWPANRRVRHRRHRHRDGPHVRHQRFLEVHAASTMKVPVLLELYRSAAAGEIRLDDRIPVRNRFRSIADTLHHFARSRRRQRDAAVRADRRHATFRDLARRMTVRSSNLATNILIDTLNAARVQTTADRVGGDGMRVLRGVEDGPAFRAGMNNTTTARASPTSSPPSRAVTSCRRSTATRVIDILARAGVQRDDPGRAAGGHARGAQDRLDHGHPARWRHHHAAELAAVRAGRAVARRQTDRRPSSGWRPTSRA
jgi:hypothetical protein